VSKHEKGQILDQVCEVTGYTHKYALTLLKYPPDFARRPFQRLLDSGVLSMKMANELQKRSKNIDPF
jgi:hypothetical protein